MNFTHKQKCELEKHKTQLRRQETQLETPRRQLATDQGETKFLQASNFGVLKKLLEFANPVKSQADFDIFLAKQPAGGIVAESLGAEGSLLPDSACWVIFVDRNS